MTPPYTHQIRVRWGEVDGQQVVFNPNYLVYADVAGTEYFRHIGADHSNIPDFLELYVVDAHLGFKAPARYDDLIDCAVEPLRIGNSSFQLRVTITRAAELLTEITLTYVRAIDSQSKPLSDAFRALLATPQKAQA